MKNSSIEWTHHTFNPWIGCQKVSPGCQHCYAEVLDRRYGHDNWGPAKTTDRRVTSAAYWRQPLKWNREALEAGERRRVFCASMADVFEEHPQLVEPRARLFELIEATPGLDWLLLTKRPENIADMVPVEWLYAFPENVWAGTSVENQEQADKRIPHLLRVPAVVRFLSCEPLLGPVDLGPWLVCERCKGEGDVFQTRRAGRQTFFGRTAPCPECKGSIWRRDLSWVIVGGESGHGARPMHPDWARGLREDCENANIPYFFKQHGEYLALDQAGAAGVKVSMIDAMNANTIGGGFLRVGKKAAGRLLDGREHNAMPAPVEVTR